MSEGLPECLDETERTVLGIGSIMSAHNLLDGIRSLVCVIERNCADVVVQNVGLDDSVKELSANETEFSIDRGSRSSSIRPAFASVMRERRIGVLKVGDGD